MCSWLAERRLREVVELSVRQKGFKKGNGTFANCFILDHMMRKGKGSSLVCVLLDLNKAFDSVPHKALLRALRGFRVLGRLVGDYKNM